MFHMVLTIYAVVSLTKAESKSKLYYDRRSVGQPILVSSPILDPRPNFYYCQTVASMLMWGTLFNVRRGLSFTIAAVARRRSHPRVWIPLDSWSYFTAWDSKLTQPGGPGSRIYISQEQGDPVILPGTGFPFLRLLRLTGLRWRYLNPPPHRGSINSINWLAFLAVT
jgi:hypothetical protein